MKHQRNWSNALLWAIYLSLLAVLLPHTAWAFARFEPWGVQLLVEDNGPGSAMPGRESLIQEGHLGLTGMAERAQLFGGQLEIQATPGQGTTIDLRLNIIQNEEAS